MLSDEELKKVYHRAYDAWLDHADASDHYLAVEEGLRAVEAAVRADQIAAMSDFVHELGNLSFGGTGCGCNSDFVFDSETRDLFAWAAAAIRTQLPIGNTPTPDYVGVIAQLEGDGA